MEELTFEGKIEDIAVKPKKTGTGDFVKLKVNGKTFNFFDYGYYDKMRSNFKVGAEVSIVYMTNTFTTDDGSERTSNTANAIAFDRIKDAKAFMPVQKELPMKKEIIPKEEDESSVESIMEKCLIKSYQILNKLGENTGITFESEDVRTVGVTMFIESCRRMK